MTEKLKTLIKSNTVDNSIDLSDDVFDELTENELQEIIDYAHANNISIVDTSEKSIDYNVRPLEYAQSYFDYVKTFEVLPHEEIVELFKKYNNGDKEAKNIIIEHNLRLVLHIASRYYSSTYVDFDDLVQMGNIGLMKAVEMYDYTKNFHFSTYATYWIKQKILRTIYENQHVRIPIHVYSRMLKMQSIISNYIAEFQSEPSDEYLAEKLKVSVDDIADLRRYIVTNERVSLSAPVGDEEDSTLEEFIPDSQKSAETLCFNNALHDIIQEILSSEDFKEKEADIIKRRFGLDPYEYPQTLEDVAKEYKCTKEQIRMIEHKACKKLRHPKYKHYLADFI